MGTARAGRSIAIVFTALALAIVACGDDPEPATLATDTIVVEVLHASVDAPRYLDGHRRLELLPPLLAASRVDVVCLQGIAKQEDRLLVRAALANVFPASLELPTADDTPVDDPRDGLGRTPPAPERPPCALVETEMARHESCMLLEKRTQERGGVVRFLEDVGACISQGLLDADPDRRCTQCLLSHERVGNTVRDATTRCAKVLHPLVNGGQHGMMILSRFQLARPTIHVLPSETTRRAVLGATITTPRGREVDVFCASLGGAQTSVLFDAPFTGFPYPGPYGSKGEGWLRENELQIEKLATHVAARRAERPAIVMGNFGVSGERVRNGAVVLPALGPVGAARLDALFTSGVASDWAAACTVCRDNALAPSQSESFENRIYLAGLPQTSVTTSSRTHLGNLVPPDATDTLLAVRRPMFVQYGFRSSIAVPIP